MQLEAIGAFKWLGDNISPPSESVDTTEKTQQSVKAK